MKIKNDFNNFFFIFFSLLPLSIVLGPSISLFNIIILILIYLYIFFHKDHYKILINNNVIKLLFFIFFYLIFNTIFSIDYEIGLIRNLGFIRLILLFILINYFFFLYQNNLKIFNFWTFLIFIIVLDVYVERFTGTNVFGWGAEEINGIKQPNGARVVSFFKDEPIVGGYLNGFIFLISGYVLLKVKEKKLNIFIFLILISIFLFSIVITGERSNTIKAAIGIILFFGLSDFIRIRHKIYLLTGLMGIMILIISSSSYLKERYIGQLYAEAFLGKEANFIQDNIYLKLYRSGFNVFKNHPYFGVGNKNYRIETCNSDLKLIEIYNYECSTHPHQIYIEFLSEHGIVGSLILLSVLFFLIFKNLKIIILSQNYLQIGCLIHLLINFMPLLPSGSFFGDFNLTLFFINFSLMYALNKNTNIFFVEKKI